MAQIISRSRVQTFGEVFTAQKEVKAMCDMLPPEMYQPDKTFLEPAVGEGVFLLEILRRKFANCHKRADYSTALASVFGIDIQADNVKKTINNILELCQGYFGPTKKDVETLTMHIMQGDSVKIMNMMGWCKMEWTPCSERMPEEREWIGTKQFGTTISDEVYVTFESTDGQRFTDHISFQNGKLSSADERHMKVWYKGAKPIAWMPLPEPYKEGKQ